MRYSDGYHLVRLRLLYTPDFSTVYRCEPSYLGRRAFRIHTSQSGPHREEAEERWCSGGCWYCYHRSYRLANALQACPNQGRRPYFRERWDHICRNVGDTNGQSERLQGDSNYEREELRVAQGYLAR